MTTIQKGEEGYYMPHAGLGKWVKCHKGNNPAGTQCSENAIWPLSEHQDVENPSQVWPLCAHWDVAY